MTEDWAEIRRLHKSEQMSIKAIVRKTGLARNTVRAALASDAPPKYERAPVGSMADAYEPRIWALLAEFPSMPATVIAERIGWTNSSSVLRAKVAQLRPLYAPMDPADRTTYVAGEIVQCDLWFPGKVIPVDVDPASRRPGWVGGRPAVDLPVLTMVAAFSGFIMALLLPTRKTGDLVAGMWQLLSGLGGVPKMLVWDNESGIGQHHRLTVGARGFCERLQPSPSAYRDRHAHPRRRPLRARRCYRPRPRHSAPSGPPRPPRTIRHARNSAPQDPRPATGRLDQPAATGRDPTRRLTPTGLIRLDKLRRAMWWRRRRWRTVVNGWHGVVSGPDRWQILEVPGRGLSTCERWCERTLSCSRLNSLASTNASKRRCGDKDKGPVPAKLAGTGPWASLCLAGAEDVLANSCPRGGRGQLILDLAYQMGTFVVGIDTGKRSPQAVVMAPSPASHPAMASAVNGPSATSGGTVFDHMRPQAYIGRGAGIDPIALQEVQKFVGAYDVGDGLAIELGLFLHETHPTAFSGADLDDLVRGTMASKPDAWFGSESKWRYQKR